MKQKYIPTEEGFFRTVSTFLPPSDIETCHQCFSRLKKNLGADNLNSHSIQEWMKTQKDSIGSDLLSYRKTAGFLMIQEYMNCAFNGRSCKESLFNKHFSLEFYYLIYLYINEDVKISDSARKLRRNYASKVLRLFQKRNAVTISDINYNLVHNCIKEITLDSNYANKSNLRSCLRGMLNILCKFQSSAYGCLVLAELLSYRNDDFDFWLYLDSNTIESIKEEAKNTSQGIAVFRLLQIRDEIGLQIENQISKNIRDNYIHVINQLYVFLDYNGITSYTPHIGDTWLSSIFNVRALSVRRQNNYKRALYLINVKYDGQQIDLAKRRGKPAAINFLPEWCKKTANDYISRKIKEGWATTTIRTARNSITRFLYFLDKNGVTSWDEIDPKILNKFVIEDNHATPQGKNAYIIRIRHFLEYLEEVGLIHLRGLYAALPSVCATTERNVEILKDEEQEKIYDLCKAESELLSKRGKAILLLGLDMGLRRIDIASMCISNIDWDRQMLKIVQEKTKYEIELAIPTRVMNALFQYIMTERPESTDFHIFLTENKPYRPLNPATCGLTIGKAIPERKQQSHILRKTHASKALNNGATLDDVRDLLGHSDRSNVHKYLSLDEKHMKQCAISLEEYGIKGERFEWRT